MSRSSASKPNIIINSLVKYSPALLLPFLALLYWLAVYRPAVEAERIAAAVTADAIAARTRVMEEIGGGIVQATADAIAAQTRIAEQEARVTAEYVALLTREAEREGERDDAARQTAEANAATAAAAAVTATAEALQAEVALAATAAAQFAAAQCADITAYSFALSEAHTIRPPQGSSYVIGDPGSPPHVSASWTITNTAELCELRNIQLQVGGDGGRIFKPELYAADGSLVEFVPPGETGVIRIVFSAGQAQNINQQWVIIVDNPRAPGDLDRAFTLNRGAVQPRLSLSIANWVTAMTPTPVPTPTPTYTPTSEPISGDNDHNGPVCSGEPYTCPDGSTSVCGDDGRWICP